MGWIVVVTGVFFGLALALLGAFFMTKDARFDRVAEWCFVLFGILAIPTILEVDRRLAPGPITTAFTVLGLGGAAGTALGELAATLRLLDFRRLAMPLTLAFAAFLAWIGGASVLTLLDGGLPAAIGWLGAAAIVVALAMLVLIARQPGAIQGDVAPGTPQVAAMVVSMGAIVVWLVLLGASL